MRSTLVIIPKFMWNYVIEYLSIATILSNPLIADMITNDGWKNIFHKNKSSNITIIVSDCDTINDWKYACQTLIACDTIEEMHNIIKKTIYSKKFTYYKIFIGPGEYAGIDDEDDEYCNNRNTNTNNCDEYTNNKDDDNEIVRYDIDNDSTITLPYYCYDIPYSIELIGSDAKSTIIANARCVFRVSKYLRIKNITFTNNGYIFRRYVYYNSDKFVNDDKYTICISNCTFVKSCIQAESFNNISITQCKCDNGEVIIDYNPLEHARYPLNGIIDKNVFDNFEICVYNIKSMSLSQLVVANNTFVNSNTLVDYCREPSMMVLFTNNFIADIVSCVSNVKYSKVKFMDNTFTNVSKLLQCNCNNQANCKCKPNNVTLDINNQFINCGIELTKYIEDKIKK